MTKILVLVLTVLIASMRAEEQSIQPYIIIGESGKSISGTEDDIVESFFMKNIDILGKYHPAGDKNRLVLVVSNGDLIRAVQKGKPSAGFLAAIRIAITREDDMTYVSCQNPEYWGNVYFQEDYLAVRKHILKFREKLFRAMPKMRGRFNWQFGCEKGCTPEKMRHYRYMFGMPYFEDMVELAEFDSYADAVATVENNFSQSEFCTKVFEKEIPGKNVKLYGVGLGGDRGEGRFISILDVADIKHPAFLPYEMLVIENKVYMLSGRFRIPVSFPDMTLRTFMKLLPTFRNIEEMMKSLTMDL